MSREIIIDVIETDLDIGNVWLSGYYRDQGRRFRIVAELTDEPNAVKEVVWSVEYQQASGEWANCTGGYDQQSQWDIQTAAEAALGRQVLAPLMVTLATLPANTAGQVTVGANPTTLTVSPAYKEYRM